ncbi:MBL fold metallo-hydrolase [Mycolicibacterium sediminis]|uniref:MBL fold hydrolase n=1 Tax=Mycolicibacterium sediminis TaxID=1286180 RepID=A0A7I7QMF3_9MYCO|nr:MBL fold metallo-hydrolase [Mycolicibacterium sediminis]BBY27066.1 MBL fold hydrolase [Mycolicibacterium sediminis]
MSDEIGVIGAQSSVRRWVMDDVTFTYVVDGAMSLVPSAFLPAIPAAYWHGHPDELDAHDTVAMSTGGLLVQRDDECVLIDAGFGPVNTNSPFGRVDCGALLTSLESVGVAAADVDVVALTHLHVDHTGWLFTPTADGGYAPTFPNAVYVVAESEWAPYADGQTPAGMPDRRAVIEPLSHHPRLTLVGDAQEIASAITTLITPGHSSGHTSYVVASESGRRLIAFGDAFHVPAQLRNPEWGSGPDADPTAVPGARRRIIAELLDADTCGFAIHFGDQAFGQVLTSDDGTLRWQPTPTKRLAPPPRTA